MQRQMLKSKVHRATITACDVDYEVVAVDSDPSVLLDDVSPAQTQMEALS